MVNDRKQIHPLLLEKNKRWIGAVENKIVDLDNLQQKMIMQEAGKTCSFDIWALCEKALGRNIDSVGDLIRGWNLVRQSRNLHGEWIIKGNEVHGVFKECGCPLVRANLVELQPVHCWCSLNMLETIFSRVAKGKVSVEIKQSIGRGDNVCEFSITL